LKEYLRNVKNGETEKSAIAAHACIENVTNDVTKPGLRGVSMSFFLDWVFSQTDGTVVHLFDAFRKNFFDLLYYFCSFIPNQDLLF
ncbi:hypothetical protein L9F63_017056, partial [Diploptera punctata]